MKQTEHYGLTCPERWDGPDRAAHGENLVRIDTALHQAVDTLTASIKEKCQVVAGRFTGSAPPDTMEEQTIRLGFPPRAVFTGTADFQYSGADGYNSNCVLIYPGAECSGATGWKQGKLSLTTDGFRVAGLSNHQGVVYQYLAIR